MCGECRAFCCFDWFCKEKVYCFDYFAECIGFSIYLSTKCFPFLLHCIIFGKSHNLLKLFYRKGVSTVFKSLFK